MSNVILITGNSGQGKTTFAANLAHALRINGNEVLLVDADSNTPKLCYHFQILPQRTIQDVLLNRYTIKEALYQHPDGLKILFSSLATIKAPHPSKLLQEFKKTANIIIIDVPTNDTAWYESGEPTILVSQPDFPSIMETQKLRKKILNVQGLVINRANNDKYELSPQNINQLTNLQIIGTIPEEKCMREALKLGYTLIESHPESRTTTIIKQIAAKTTNQEYKEPEPAGILKKLGLIP